MDAARSSSAPVDEPLLGLATTEELMRELISRFTITNMQPYIRDALVLAEMLGGLSAADKEYRTVDDC